MASSSAFLFDAARSGAAVAGSGGRASGGGIGDRSAVVSEVNSPRRHSHGQDGGTEQEGGSSQTSAAAVGDNGGSSSSSNGGVGGPGEENGLFMFGRGSPSNLNRQAAFESVAGAAAAAAGARPGTVGSPRRPTSSTGRMEVGIAAGFGEGTLNQSFERGSAERSGISKTIGGQSSSSGLVSHGEEDILFNEWSTVLIEREGHDDPFPCQRSLHAAACYEHFVIIFGGYDGAHRVNDCYAFDTLRHRWIDLNYGTNPTVGGRVPQPRDRHIAVVNGHCFYVFGGYDGNSRVNDFHGLDLKTHQWFEEVPRQGVVPTPRHSHSAVVYGGSMYVFGGYDGCYRRDFHRYDFATRIWQLVNVAGGGQNPAARYRTTCVVLESRGVMVLFGGHDGAQHLNDVHIFDFGARRWDEIVTFGPKPQARDSHAAVAHGNSVFVFGGSTGTAMNDFHELRLESSTWVPVRGRGKTPSPRFCHCAVVVRDRMMVFGGYDGMERLNEFVQFTFGPDFLSVEVPKGTLVEDMKAFVNNAEMSDVAFSVQGETIHAHRVLCMRCPYFKALLAGGMKEASTHDIKISGVSPASFLSVLEYLYTDTVEIPADVDLAMELFEAADMFGIDRLKLMCESCMLQSISTENAAFILMAADAHHARGLRAKCLSFVLKNFDEVSRTKAMEEVVLAAPQLVIEILKSRA